MFSNKNKRLRQRHKSSRMYSLINHGFIITQIKYMKLTYNYTVNHQKTNNNIANYSP